MNNFEDGFVIPVSADVSGFSSAMADLQKQSQRFGSVFSGTIRSAITSGKSFEETLKSLALRLSGLALSAGLKPLEKLAGNFFENLISGFTPNANGNVVGSTGIVPFADGGVVSSPTFFQTGRTLGLMGEAGAEAILPLSRGSDGKLGVRTQGGGQPVNVVFNVATPDVQGFRKSEGQISAMLARTVSRGRRGL